MEAKFNDIAKEADRMTAKQGFLVEGIISDMVKWLMENRKLSLQVALVLIYNSRTFEQLQYPATGFSTESFTYNYDFLNSELKNGKLFRRKSGTHISFSKDAC